MSDHYKTITRTKATAQGLYDRAWSKNQIVTEMGISHGLYNEIMTYDPVSVKIRDVTVEKLRLFLEKHEDNVQPKPERKGKHKVVSKDDGFHIEVPPSMEEAIPPETAIDRDPGGTENLLAELSALAERFAKQGYRLDASCSLNHPPK